MEKVNALGLACPVPIIRAKKALQNNDQIQILVDNEMAVQNLKKMADQLGYNYDAKKNGDQYAIEITKGAEKGNDDETAPSVTNETTDLPAGRIDPADTHSLRLSEGYIVAVNTDVMGHGDDKLGALLITQDAQSVEDLEELKQQGVKVLACGTCVDYYGLKDQIKVAEITDMFHIVELLRKAQRVVRP